MGTAIASYEREGEWIYHAYPLTSGGEFRIQGKDVRRGRWGTGIHAQVAVAVNGPCVAYSNINIERSEDRGKLCRDAFKQMGEVHQAEFPELRMRSAMDGFCFGLWDASVEQYAGGLMAGDLSIGAPTLFLGEHVIEQGSSIIFSPPGAGKSFVLMASGVSMDAGIETLWRCPQQRNTGYVNLERGARSMQYRLARVNRALGLPPTRPLPFLNARGKSLSTVIDGIRKMIEVNELEVVLIDSLSRAGAGSLVADDVANSITDSLNGLETTWAALAHSPRGDSTHLFGSMHFEAAQDIGVQLLSQVSSDGMTVGVGLKVVQANDIKTGGLSFIALDFDMDGLRAIRPTDGKEFPNIASQRTLSKADSIASYLVDAGATAASDIAEAIGLRRDEISRELNSNDRFVFVEKDGRKSLYGVRQQGA